MPNTVRLHRVLATKPEKVYRAFVEADAMAKWLPPNGFTCTVHHLDAKVGGTYRMSFRNFTTGMSHSFGGKYLELVGASLSGRTRLGEHLARAHVLTLEQMFRVVAADCRWCTARLTFAPLSSLRAHVAPLQKWCCRERRRQSYVVIGGDGARSGGRRYLPTPQVVDGLARLVQGGFRAKRADRVRLLL
jgi:hypothetical protein